MLNALCLFLGLTLALVVFVEAFEAMLLPWRIRGKMRLAGQASPITGASSRRNQFKIACTRMPRSAQIPDALTVHPKTRVAFHEYNVVEVRDD